MSGSSEELRPSVTTLTVYGKLPATFGCCAASNVPPLDREGILPARANSTVPKYPASRTIFSFDHRPKSERQYLSARTFADADSPRGHRNRFSRDRHNRRAIIQRAKNPPSYTHSRIATHASIPLERAPEPRHQKYRLRLG